MKEAIAAAAAAAVLALAVSFIKGTEPRVGGVISVVLAVWMTFVIAGQVSYFRDGLSEAAAGGAGGFLPYILKSVSIGFFTQICSDICADAGERTVASGVLTAGKLGILAVCLPLIRTILETAIGYIS